MAGVLAAVGVHALVLVLYAVLPGRWVDGYARDPATGRPLRYHLNGLLVFMVVVLGFMSLVRLRVLPFDLFYRHWVSGAIASCLLGLAFTGWIVLGTGAAPRGRLLSDLFLGRLENPQALGGRVDAKMYLYLTGATLLELNILSAAAHSPTLPADLHVVLFSFFLVEYLLFEEVHLYTYDFIAERVGFKLGWGCLVFYPYFYNVGLWSGAVWAMPAGVYIAAAVLFFGGWVLSRGANLQKHRFKTRPEATFLGIRPRTVEGRLLCSGFWGLSRHINYLGEILMASGLALSLAPPQAIWPWLYPLYYVALLVPRQIDDERRCAAKYGASWQEYRRRVPYRIIPWVY